MNNEFNINEIVKIEQMPIVFEQLEKIGQFISEKTKDLDKLQCTEENKQEVKNRRTEINNALKMLEDKRKDIKTSLLEPYEKFNEKYELECKHKLEEASNILKEKIDTIENEQKSNKEIELRTFFYEYKETYHLDFVEFEDIGLNISLSASMKSLKEQIKDFCERISKDIKLIEKDEESDQLMLEYQNNGYDYQDAKLRVIERKQLLEKMQQQREKQEEVKKQEEKVVEIVQEIVAPKEIIEDDQLLEVNFTIKATKEKIKLLKQFLKENEIEVI